MGKVIIVILLAFVLTSFQTEMGQEYFIVRNDSFGRGEVINFKMTYGFFTVGKGSARIHPEYFKFNDRHCFKVDVEGKTVGMVDWVADVDDRFGAYIDTAALVPHQFYRRIREGRYK